MQCWTNMLMKPARSMWYPWKTRVEPRSTPVAKKATRLDPKADKYQSATGQSPVWLDRRTLLTTAVSSPRPTPMDPIKELTEQLAALTLLIKSNLSEGKPTPSVSTSTPQVSAAPTSRSDRTPRCIWCDSREHARRSDCTLFTEALNTGNIKINDHGRVAFTSTGAETPPAFGRGGMKSFYDVV